MHLHQTVFKTSIFEVSQSSAFSIAIPMGWISTLFTNMAPGFDAIFHRRTLVMSPIPASLVPLGLWVYPSTRPKAFR